MEDLDNPHEPLNVIALFAFGPARVPAYMEAVTKARKVLAEALRKKFPSEADMSDADLIAKHNAQEQVSLLSEYFTKLQRDQALLDAQLLNVG